MVDQSCPYLYRKRGVFYFSRRVPTDLQEHYKTDRLVISLRTKTGKSARVKATSLSSQLDEDWLTLRWRTQDNPLRRFLADQATEAKFESSAPLLSEAKAIYLRTKGIGRPITFNTAVDRAIGNLTDLVGDKPIDTYTRIDANLLRDSFFDRGLSRGSVDRMFSTIRAAINFTARELGHQEITSFSGIYLGEEGRSPETKRLPIPIPTLRSIQQRCHQMDDEGRWLVALISDTGMRLSEAAGLLKTDLQLNHKHPHIVLKGNQWRRLKTKGSERIVPLVGKSLWAAQQALRSSDTKFLFPRYCSEEGCKSNSASAALNKWLRPRVPDGCVMHSFRHSIRDRLRAVECPHDITDRLGGWTVGGVGEAYGTGYPLNVLYKWMEKAVKR
jgi:integrase